MIGFSTGGWRVKGVKGVKGVEGVQGVVVGKMQSLTLVANYRCNFGGSRRYRNRRAVTCDAHGLI